MKGIGIKLLQGTIAPLFSAGAETIEIFYGQCATLVCDRFYLWAILFSSELFVIHSTVLYMI